MFSWKISIEQGIRRCYTEEKKRGNPMYYALIVLSVAMFGGCFALNDVYRKIRGSNIKISLQFSLIGSLAGFVVLLLVNGLKLECTPFTLIMAILSSLNGFAFTFCSFKALDRINLSLYSLFSMLGGMMLPFLQGILFYGEKMSLAKWVCFTLITIALVLTVEKGDRKKGTIYYICIFVLNGMSGVLSKFYAEATFPKASATGYSNLSAVCSIVISAILLLTLFRKKPECEKFTIAGMAITATSGVANIIANLILVIALAHVDASVQYPMVTGGVMIVSTLISFFGTNKPTTKEIMSVMVAFLGLILLFALPL